MNNIFLFFTLPLSIAIFKRITPLHKTSLISIFIYSTHFECYAHYYELWLRAKMCDAGCNF